MSAAKPVFEPLIQKNHSYTIQDIFQDYNFKILAHQTLEIHARLPQGATVFLKTTDPNQFLASLLAALEKDCLIFLGNNQWQSQEWQEALEIVNPNVIIRETELKFLSAPFNQNAKAKIMIPTGGSSGKIRFVQHNWETLRASVEGFCDYFKLQTVNCFCILPLYHVSGLMQFMRTFITGGNLILSSYKRLTTAWQNQDSVTLRQLETISQRDYFLSLVPTQLQQLLDGGAGQWLSQFKGVLLGGAPSSRSLLETARQYNIPIALTYGMTETASQVVTLKPDHFRKGNNSVGQVLPHAKVSIQSELGEDFAAGRIGIITIQSKSLGLGYYPDSDWNRERFITDDLGYFDQAGYLHIIGRNSRKIISGGENVFPDEVESAILATGLVRDVYVMGIADQEWGEVVSAIYVPRDQSVLAHMIKTKLKQHLSSYKIPKQWSAVASIFRNEQGKVVLSKLHDHVKA